MIADLLFLMFAGLLLLAASGVVMAKNPMFCVLFLILAFFNSAGLFLLLGAEFLGLLLVMVYVGAVAVMFLFVLMTINVDFAVLKEGFANYLPIGLVLGGVLLLEVVLAAWGGLFGGDIMPTATLPTPPETENINAIGQVLFTNYVYPFQLAALILLVAMVGAIVLTHRSRPRVRRQNVSTQIARTPASAVKVVRVETGAPAERSYFKHKEGDE